LAVNWRFFGKVSNEGFDHLVDELAAGRLSEEIPPHGTLCRTRRTVGLVASTAATDAASDVAPVQEAPEGGTDRVEQQKSESGEVQPAEQADTEAAAGESTDVQTPPGGED
jgi:hypothetical protein